jgi:hypothetical protein
VSTCKRWNTLAEPCTRSFFLKVAVNTCGLSKWIRLLGKSMDVGRTVQMVSNMERMMNISTYVTVMRFSKNQNEEVEFVVNHVCSLISENIGDVARRETCHRSFSTIRICQWSWYYICGVRHERLSSKASSCQTRTEPETWGEKIWMHKMKWRRALKCLTHIF